MRRGWLAPIAASTALLLPIATAEPTMDVQAAIAPPRRIVSAALAADEMLLELVDPKRIVGLTYLIDDPLASAAAGRAPAHSARVFGPVEPMLALQPDRVVVAPYTPSETLALLGAAGAPVVRLGPHRSFEDVLANVFLLGRATASEARAAELAAEVRARLARIGWLAPLRPAPRVLVWARGYAFGRETLADDCIRRAGGENVVSARGEVTSSIESALGLDPDIIVVSTHEASVRKAVSDLLDDGAAWAAARAVREGRVYAIPASWLGAVSHHALRALEALARLLRNPVEAR